MKKSFNYILTVVAAIMIAACCFEPAGAQKKLQKSPGGYHGELDFPMSWKRYYSWTEWSKIMHDLQKQYPQLADIESIGKSRMGKDQYMLTITAKSTGSHDTKAAMWVDGAIHGNEINGVNCSLYLAWYLLTRYDYDEYVHNLVNNFTFYIVPGMNIDANESYAAYPNTPNNPRETYRPEDNDGDGLYDEDMTEDVDGDGEISIMWQADPNGRFKMSADKRRFVPVTEEDINVVKFRRVGQEGYDNDGDGRINEDDIGGPDPNRNFSYGWQLQAGWPYPHSESETRNVFNAQLARPNIFASFHYHNAGRLIMMQAPPDNRRNMSPRELQRWEMMFDRRYAEAKKKDKYASWQRRPVAAEFQHDMDTQNAICTEGNRILRNYRPVIGGLTGQQHAAVYYMLGSYAYLMELWGRGGLDSDYNQDGRTDPDEYMLWVDRDLNGEGWITPKKVDHPDLGEVYIGGGPKKHLDRTPPARYIEQETFKNAQFVLYCVSQFPRIEIEKIDVTPATGDLLWINVTLKNDKQYPTYSDMMKYLGKQPDDKLMFNSSNNITLVNIPDKSTRTDMRNPLSEAESFGEKEGHFRVKGKESKQFRFLARMTGSSGWVEITADSRFAGTVSKRLNIRLN